MSLPIKHDLTTIYILSCAVAILMTVASVSSLLHPERVYQTADLVRALATNDALDLLVGLPMLLGSMLAARRGSFTGLLLWPGALLYVLYNYLPPLLCVPRGAVFGMELALVAVTAYATVALLVAIDGAEVRKRLVGAVPNRTAGGVLAALGTLTLARVIELAIRGASISSAEIALSVTDLLMSPLWIIGGVLLWRRASLGFAAGLGLLFQGSMLFVALIALLLAQRSSLKDLLVVAAMGLIVFVPFGLFARGVARSRS